MVSGKSWEGSRDRARIWGRASYRERGLYCTARSVTGSLDLVPGHPVQLALCPRACHSASWWSILIHTHPFPLLVTRPVSLYLLPWSSDTLDLSIAHEPPKDPEVSACVCLKIRAVSEGNHYFPGPFLAWGLPWSVDAQGTEGGRTTWKGSLDTFPSFVISSPTLDLEQVNSDRSHSHWGTPSPYNSFRGWTLETLWQPCPRGNTCTKLEKNQSNNQGIF